MPAYADRLAQLLPLPRVFWNPCVAENKVDGLVDLCRAHIQPTHRGVEVGCLAGVSSRVIALHCAHLDCVDAWWNTELLVEAERLFDAMLVEYPNITKVKATSLDAAKQYADASLDFVYIDADHSYESVVADITAWKPKVKLNGFIAGHDSHMTDVLRAVRDCLREPDHYFSDMSWLVQLHKVV